MAGFDDIGPFVQSIVRDEQSRLHYLATVVAITGTQMTVRRLGAPAASTPEGPYATQQGVAGTVKPGELVAVDWVRGHPIIGFAVEGVTRTNLMTIVGADTSVGQTTSVSAWVELLRVDGLAIPPAGFAICHITAEARRVGTSPATQKQLRFLINGQPSVAYNIGATDSFTVQSITIPLWIGAYSAGLSFEDRIFGFLSGTNLTAVAEAEINSISIEGRTQDTGSGDDVVAATNLLVFA